MDNRDDHQTDQGNEDIVQASSEKHQSGHGQKRLVTPLLIALSLTAVFLLALLIWPENLSAAVRLFAGQNVAETSASSEAADAQSETMQTSEVTLTPASEYAADDQESVGSVRADSQAAASATPDGEENADGADTSAAAEDSEAAEEAVVSSSQTEETVPVWETYDTEKEYAWLCDHRSLFTDDKVAFAEGNADLIHFLYTYGNGQTPVVPDTSLTEEETAGGVPFLYQWDERWGYQNYGNTVIGLSGCGPTSLAMVIVGLTGREDVTPYTVAQYAEENGYYIEGEGTSWALFGSGCENWGITSTEVPRDENSLREVLSAGQPVIVSVSDGMFTTGGHIMVLSGLDADGNFILHDPNNRTYSSRSFTYSEIEDQIVHMWAFQAIQ